LPGDNYDERCASTSPYYSPHTRDSLADVA